MPKHLNEKFARWAQAPTQVAIEQTERAERVVAEAVHAAAALRGRDVRVFLHGSHRNRTSISGIAVDAGVAYYSPPADDARDSAAARSAAAPYPYAQFKDEIGVALVARFGASAVQRTDKVFRVRADANVAIHVAPFFEHRQHIRGSRHATGVVLHPDGGVPPQVVNWPDQHFANGQAKDDATDGRYRATVRVLKHLRNEMRENAVPSAQRISGYLIECLAWNVPNSKFGGDTHYHDLRECLVYVFNETKSDDLCAKWREVNRVENLFPGHAWTRQDAQDFVVAAWHYVGYQ
ncbi:MAG TPA: hypothetical protein VJR92_16200 [Gemmatimonadaceae bacterium]|nr:hypothetical protein [Gemmatimonadaceae bacterium]